MPPYQIERLQLFSQAVPGYIALARGDTSSAIRTFADLPHDVLAPLEWLTEALLLARTGQDAEALRLLDRAFPITWTSPLNVMSRLEAARAAERLGQRGRAVVDYQHVIDAWRHADPELQPHVEEARAALVRLAGEPS